MPTVGEKMVKATEPTRAPNFPWLAPLLEMLRGPQQPDTGWHDQMVDQANQSFRQPQPPPAPTAPPVMPRRKPLQPMRQGQ